jgi:hypothetical protein
MSGVVSTVPNNDSCPSTKSCLAEYRRLLASVRVERQMNAIAVICGY